MSLVLRKLTTLVKPAVTFSALKHLVLDVDSDLGTTLTPIGNMLEAEFIAHTPVSAPPAGKGVVFKVQGGAVTIYVWDGTQWVST